MMIRTLFVQFRRSVAFLFIAFGLCLPQAAQAQTAADLIADINAASPGDTIIVPAGDYGAISLRWNNFAPAVTLKFENGAVIQTMQLRDVTGLVFEDVTISGGVAPDPVRNYAVFVQRGGDITFKNSHISWAIDGDPSNDGPGLVFDGVDGIRVENSHISDVRDGIIIRSSSNVEILGSHFTDLLKDGINLSGTDNVVIRENACTDFRSIEGFNAHPDCIQLQTGYRLIANSNVLIVDNAILIQDGEKAQGIFVKSKYAGVPHRQITIENNLIRHSVTLGVYAENVDDLIIRENDVLPSHDAIYAPRIVVHDLSTNVLIEGNTASRIDAPAHATVQNNTILE